MTEIHIANTASEVMWSCNATTNEHERKSLNRQCFERNARCARAQLRNFVRHNMPLRLAEVGR